MNGIELAEVCKAQETCMNCPKKKECAEWKKDIKTLEPWELEKVTIGKEY